MSDGDADESQRTLTAFGAGTQERPEGEAEHVAGNGGQSAEVVDIDEARFPPTAEQVTLSVTQVDYTVEGYGDDEFPVLHVFGRRPRDGSGANGGGATAGADHPEAVHVRVYGFRPYFYTPLSALEHEEPDGGAVREEHVRDSRLVEEARLTGIETYGDLRANGEPVADERADDELVLHESIRGTDLVKVFGQTPRDVGQLRDQFDHYEADILFPNRLLIDKDITSGVSVPAREQDDGAYKVHHTEIEPVDCSVSPRVNTFDIEVDDRSGFPEEGEEPIICLTSHDSYRDEYVVWLYTAPEGIEGPDSLPGYEPIGDGELDVKVRAFDEEVEMLDAFVSYIEETDPDLTTGWNFEDFDAPYLIDRIDRLADEGADPEVMDSDRLSRVNEVWDSGWGGPNVKGRVVFDLLYAYKRTQFTELESYRLDAVGEMELGAGKERYAGDIGDLWEQDPERLLEYNLRDVELCVEIDRKQEVIPFWEEVASFVGCKLEDATTPGDAVDLYILHKVHGDFALPSKGTVESEEFEGGAVFDPITGVRENVTVLDLKCFSGDTELLTPEGVRNIRDIEVGDPVYTLNPETFECEVKPVAETHRYQNRFGELHHLSGNTHDLKVTENHRLLISDERGWDEQSPEDFEFEEYRDIPEYERFAFPQHGPMAGERPGTFDLVDEVEGGHVVVYSDADLRSFRASVPEAVTERLDLAHGTSAALDIEQKVGKYLIPLSVYREYRETIETHADHVFLKHDRGHRETPLSFGMDDWLRLLGWFVTEGSIDRAGERITLHQSDDEGRRTIRELLDRLEINYNVDERGVNVSNRYLLEWFAEHCGEGYRNKRLPEWVFDLDGELLRVLLETMLDGDGSRADSGLGRFWTKSEHLKDAMTDIAVRCGEKPTVSRQSDGTWYVSAGKRGSFKKASNATVEDHDGDVFCVTAEENHTVLAGRNGHFQWVGQSLYPMCMVTINASPETKVDADLYDGPTYHAPNGQHFRQEPDGIIREMVDELLEEREQKKARRNEHDPGESEYEQYDRQQAAVKVIMNSLYGVLGWDRFRLYDKEMGAAVTATGREVIEFTEEVANRLNYQVAYGDTDSIMLELGGSVTKSEAIDSSFELEEAINASYDEFALERLNAEHHRFQIEFEKLYRRFFQAGKKKRYAGHIVWKEGKDVDDIDITGFEYKRSDIAPITKEVQKNVIEMVVTGEDLDDVKAYVHDVIEEFQKGDAELDRIGIPGGIGKRLDGYDTDTAQVRGAKYANLLLGTNFGRGSKPKRLYLKRVHDDFFQRVEAEMGLSPSEDPLYGEFKREQDVICFEFADQIPEEFEVDWEKMLDKTLKGPIARILEALDVSWEEVKSGQEQTGLGKFM